MDIRKYLLIGATIALPTLADAQVARKPVPDSLWTWSSDCSHPAAVRFEIRLNARVLFNQTLTLCRLSSDQARGEAEHRPIAITFSATHTFQGEYRTTAADTITCDLWQAGADPHDVILGIAFSTPRQVLLNAVHIIDPYRLRRLVQDTGLTTTSSPVAAQRSRQAVESNRQPSNEALQPAWGREAAGGLRPPAAIMRKRRSRSPRR